LPLDADLLHDLPLSRLRQSFESVPVSFARPSALLVGTILLALAAVMGACGGDAPSPQPEGAALDLAATPDTMTIDHILRTDARFSTLVAALDTTGLDSTLASAGPFTLFAPPDRAFAALPSGTVPALLGEEQDQLRRILTHHVIDGDVALSALSDAVPLITLAGDTLQVQVTDSVTTVGVTRLLDGDVEGANGRIHVIDGVLRPPPEQDGSGEGAAGGP